MSAVGPASTIRRQAQIRCLLQKTVCWSVQVAFSAFTDFGAVMALAIAVHNIPEVMILSLPAYLHCMYIHYTVSIPVGHNPSLDEMNQCKVCSVGHLLREVPRTPCSSPGRTPLLRISWKLTGKSSTTGGHCGSACVCCHREQVEGHGHCSSLGMPILGHHPPSRASCTRSQDSSG